MAALHCAAMLPLQRALAHATRFLDSLPRRHVGARADRDALRRALAVPLADDGEDAAAVIDALAAGAEEGLIGSAGPRYFGFVIGGSLPVALAADWLTSAWDQNAGLFATSPANSVCEEIAAEWLVDLLDLPRAADRTAVRVPATVDAITSILEDIRNFR